MKEFWLLLSPWQKFKFVLTILLALFTGVFAVLNWQRVEINFIFFKLHLSVTLLIVICLLVGYLMSMLFDYKKYREKEREINRLKSEIEALKNQ